MEDKILEKFKDLELAISKYPTTRERSIVLTNLDNARVWYKEMKEILANRPRYGENQ